MPRTPAKKAGAGSAHPNYETMAKEAIVALKDRTGSSTIAIAKFIKEKYGKALPDNFKQLLSRYLKKFAESGKLVKVKASYKLGTLKDAPKKKKVVKKKAAPKKKVSWSNGVEPSRERAERC